MCQILLLYLSAIDLVIFSHCLKDLICFADSFGLDSGWRKMERTFPAAHQQTVISKRNGENVETAREVLSNSALGRHPVESVSIMTRMEKKWFVLHLKYHVWRALHRWVVKWPGAESFSVEDEAGGEEDLDLRSRKETMRVRKEMNGSKLQWCCPLIVLFLNLCSTELGVFMSLIVCPTHENLCIISPICCSRCGCQFILNIGFSNELSMEIYRNRLLLNMHHHKYFYLRLWRWCGLTFQFFDIEKFLAHMI